MKINIFGDFNLEKSRNQKIWRYINLKKFQDILEKKELYFPTARELIKHDKFEGSLSNLSLSKNIPGFGELSLEQAKIFKKIYSTSFESRAFEGLLDINYISCWHKSDFESFLMWKVYGGENSICVQTTVEKLCSSLGEYRISPEAAAEEAWISDVKYVNFQCDQGDSNMLGRFFCKRIEYSDEKEFRIIISLREAARWCPGAVEPGMKVAIPINIEAMFEKIYLSPLEDKNFDNKITALLTERGINKNLVQHSLLTDFLVY